MNAGSWLNQLEPGEEVEVLAIRQEEQLWAQEPVQPVVQLVEPLPAQLGVVLWLVPLVALPMDYCQACLAQVRHGLLPPT